MDYVWREWSMAKDILVYEKINMKAETQVGSEFGGMNSEGGKENVWQ